MKFSPQQQDAISKAGAWLNQCASERKLSKPFFYLAGYAGTGKSTLASHLAALQNGAVVYAAFTGKAAKVMRDNGCFGASTIHSLIYKPKQDDETGDFKFRWNKNGPCSEASLIIIDECSMVDEVLAKDLLRYGVPVLVLGDPGQLPPVKGTGYFTEREPDAMLDEVHRQAAESPILRLATAIRTGEFRRELTREDGLVITDRREDLNGTVTSAGAIIVGQNKTRNAFNDRMRDRLGFGDTVYPKVGETLICLRNDRDTGLFNGGLWEVSRVGKERRAQGERFQNLRICLPEDRDIKIDVLVHNSFFTRTEKPFWKLLIGSQQFDYGYVLTAHKSQGSAWPEVVVFDESEVFRQEADRWLYTSVTRASEKLTLVL